MKYLISLIFTTVYAISASLTLNIAKDQNSSFSILHIKDSTPFLCKSHMRDDFKDIVICTFSKRITPDIFKSNSDLDINSIDNKLHIVPNNMMTLYVIQDDIVTANVIKSDKKNSHRHWMIVGYKGNKKLFQESGKEGIDFDISFPKRSYPFVGSLDLNGLPVVQKNDARTLKRIKDAYAEAKYEKVIQIADDLMTSNNNIFSEEAKLYKLRALDAIAWSSGDKPKDINTDDFIDTAHEWIDENPSSKNLPEVLMYLSKIYYKLGRVGKGDEYTDILKEEFYDDKNTKTALLHKADRVYKNRKKRAEALKIYKEVLYNTKDLDIASDAATRLSEKYLENEQFDLAVEFYKKVVDANEPYLQKNIKKSYEFAKRFAAAEKYDLAIQIVGTLLGDHSDKKLADDMRKDIAYWYDLNGNKDAAFGLYKQYLDDYKHGNHVGFIQSRLDKVLLDIKETNSTKKMKNIDTILAKYKDEPIYKTALIEKAKTLIEEGEYKALFEMEETLKANEAEKFLQFAAQKKIIEDLKADNCKEAVYLKVEYNATVEPEMDAKYYRCLMRLAKYSEALSVAQAHKEDKALAQRLAWMYRALKAHSKLDDNKKVILLGEDIEELLKILKTTAYDDIVYEKAEAYYNLQEFDDMMLREVKRAQTLFANDIRNIDLYIKVLRYAKNKKDDLLTASYAQKIIALQKEHKISDYSPNVELDLINALKRLRQYDKALKEDIKLLYVKLSDTQRANVLYIAGELSLKTGKEKEAKEFFIKCGEIVEDSSWQRLCAQSLELLDE